MRHLRQLTTVTVPMGPFLDKTDGVTAETALPTQTGALSRIIKGGIGGSFTAASWAHDFGGHYLIGLSESHTDTLGCLRVAFYDAATHCGVWEEFEVLPAAEYDARYGTTTELTAVPAINSGIVKMIQWMFSLARNKRTSTNSIEKVKKDDGTTDLGTAAVTNDGTTTTRDEWA